MIATLCLLISLVFALLSATGIPEHPRWRHLSAAIAFLVLALLVARLPLVQAALGPWPP